MNERLKELIKLLNEASYAYYQQDTEIMSNLEYDQLYDELVALEEKTGIQLSNSPTRKVGYEVLGDLPKEAHSVPMLSLNKTKDIGGLISFLGDQEGLLTWKLDGLTVVLTYYNGMLTKAITRGNGEVGEVITNNAKVFDNVPLSISFKGNLVVRGEAVIRYSDFKRINEELAPEDQYKNPRNLCSGTVRQLNNEITAKRHVQFLAFQIVEMADVVFEFKSKQFEVLTSLGFDCVEATLVTGNTIEAQISAYQERIAHNDFASDGLVLTFNDMAYGKNLGATSKFPKDSIAFKWEDEIKVTTLREIEWSASRTGLINPVAIFDPVELEGTTVGRASLHNLSIIEGLALGIGDQIGVYKANMIIPQVAYNDTKSGNLEVPSACPICCEPTEVSQVREVKVLICINPHCPAKMIKSLSHYVSRDAMNIDGLSEATVEKFIEQGFIKNYSDLYQLEDYKDQIITLEGFGQKSYDNLIASIEASKEVKLANFIYALGINHIGLSNAKVLAKAYAYDLEQMMQAEVEELVAINTIGEVIAKSFVAYFADEVLRNEVKKLAELLTFKIETPQVSNLSLDNQIFVVTGSLEHYENRKALQNQIELLGGKVTSSVTSKTNYLINNDNASSSSKNQKAKALGVTIITEDEFLQMIEE